MLLVIFGAGASYDSAPSYPPNAVLPPYEHRPPLANELFDDRPLFRSAFSRFPACLPLITNLRHRPDDITVEEVLEKMSAEALINPVRHQQLMAIRYCLQVLLTECVRAWSGVHGGVTNYATLLDHIQHWSRNYGRVLLVTFNYDTMLEASLGVVGITIRSIPDYIKDSRYTVVKVHGSVSWARDVVEPARIDQNPDALIHEAAQLRYSDRWWLTEACPVATLRVPWRRHPSHPAEFRDIPAVPSLALPLQTKAAFECPREHLSALAESLSHVTKALVIGWRGMEPHFTDMLSKGLPTSGPKCHIVAGSTRAAEQVQTTLNERRVPGRFSCSEFGFSGFLRTRESYEFLGGD